MLIVFNNSRINTVVVLVSVIVSVTVSNSSSFSSITSCCTDLKYLAAVVLSSCSYSSSTAGSRSVSSNTDNDRSHFSGSSCTRSDISCGGTQSSISSSRVVVVSSSKRHLNIALSLFKAAISESVFDCVTFTATQDLRKNKTNTEERARGGERGEAGAARRCFVRCCRCCVFVPLASTDEANQYCD